MKEKKRLFSFQLRWPQGIHYIKKKNIYIYEEEKPLSSVYGFLSALDETRGCILDGFGKEEMEIGRSGGHHTTPLSQTHTSFCI
jgi:hypothetical protein